MEKKLNSKEFNPLFVSDNTRGQMFALLSITVSQETVLCHT